MNPPGATREEERETLEMLAGSYEPRHEREEALWRAFIAFFARNHRMDERFTFEEVLSAYYAFLQAHLDIAKASLLLDEH